jgi:2',3'-cyclic-nucleotide 2'-phosphodiesterase (5'-nucleotidase family)
LWGLRLRRSASGVPLLWLPLCANTMELKSHSDLIALLAHIDGREESEILHSVPEIPALVTGHIHTGMSEAMSHDGRVVVRVRSYGKELGSLELKVDTDKKVPVSWNWNCIPVDSNKLAPDPEMARQVKHWEDEVTAQVDRPLAISQRAFSKNEVKHLIEQAIREETHSDFAWMNSGGVRDSLPQRQLLDRNIWNVIPFDNEVLIGTFKDAICRK